MSDFSSRPYHHRIPHTHASPHTNHALTQPHPHPQTYHPHHTHKQAYKAARKQRRIITAAMPPTLAYQFIECLAFNCAVMIVVRQADPSEKLFFVGYIAYEIALEALDLVPELMDR